MGRYSPLKGAVVLGAVVVVVFHWIVFATWGSLWLASRFLDVPQLHPIVQLEFFIVVAVVILPPPMLFVVRAAGFLADWEMLSESKRTTK